MKTVRNVAQICNLLYRRFLICTMRDLSPVLTDRAFCRMQFGDTAHCKSALRAPHIAASRRFKPQRYDGRREESSHRFLCVPRASAVFPGLSPGFRATAKKPYTL